MLGCCLLKNYGAIKLVARTGLSDVLHDGGVKLATANERQGGKNLSRSPPWLPPLLSLSLLQFFDRSSVQRDLGRLKTHRWAITATLPPGTVIADSRFLPEACPVISALSRPITVIRPSAAHGMRRENDNSFPRVSTATGEPRVCTHACTHARTHARTFVNALRVAVQPHRGYLLARSR